MRRLLLVAGASSLLSALREERPDRQHARMPTTNLTAENIVSNDVTAIDAVTGDAANMAADVDMNYGGLDDNGDGAG